jgi:hypothetical protein
LEVISPEEKERAHPNIRIRLLKRRRRRKLLAWWAMEGGIEGSFLPLPLFPQAIYLNLHFLSFTLKFYFSLVLGHYLRPPFVFLGL